jgi:stage III sporulation protein AG
MSIFKEGFQDKIVFSIILLVIMGVILVMAGEEEKPALSIITEAEPAVAVPVDNSGISALEKSLEEKIAINLESIKDVGKTKVMVTYTSGFRKEFARDESLTKRTSEETDKDGGSRKTVEITETNHLVLAGNANPLLVIEQRPEVAGVLVIAEGASDPKIRELIFEAVKTLLNVQPSKISVVPLGGV